MFAAQGVSPPPLIGMGGRAKKKMKDVAKRVETVLFPFLTHLDLALEMIMAMDECKIRN